jgi:hypothetical protein
LLILAVDNTTLALSFISNNNKNNNVLTLEQTTNTITTIQSPFLGNLQCTSTIHKEYQPKTGRHPLQDVKEDATYSNHCPACHIKQNLVLTLIPNTMANNHCPGLPQAR